MMMTRVSISGEDATGEEYAERAELQEKLDVYLEAYKALLADWRYGLTGETSAL
jgi:E3 ubiquitin-protein ligase SHPRH